MFVKEGKPFIQELVECLELTVIFRAQSRNVCLPVFRFLFFLSDYISLHV